MTREKAIETIKELREKLIKYGYIDYACWAAVEYPDALTAAIDAIKKQIPKRPIIRMETEDSEGSGFVEWICPVCRSYRATRRGVKHCSECGCRLDWEEV